jgi:serine/threonine protein kinase
MARDPLLGRSIADRYDVIEKIGEGAFGSVYAVRHRDLGKRFAMKVMHVRLIGQSRIAERFLREIQVTAAVDHPNVVDIIDTGELADGRPYYTMDLLRGEPLAAIRAREHRLPWSRVQPILLQICDALQAAHDRGVIHRDLKPANCFCIDRRGLDFIKILDFGLAKLTRDAGPDLTLQSELLGTLWYMAPEQLIGEPVDVRVDVYAAGVILFELLTGAPPFATFNRTELMHQMLTSEAPTLRSVASELVFPAGLEEVVSAALRRVPAERFASMRHLAAALRTIQPDPASHPRPAPRAGDSPVRAPGERRRPTSEPRASSRPAEPRRTPRSPDRPPEPGPDPEERTTARNVIPHERAAEAGRPITVRTDILEPTGPRPVTIRPVARPPAARVGFTGPAPMHFARIPSGSFMMGNDDHASERPAHVVRLAGFQLAVHPVTVAQWKAVMPSLPAGNDGGDELPVVNVSWFDAIEYLNRLSLRERLPPAYQGATPSYRWVPSGGYRLPTEAEWEYAARGGNAQDDLIQLRERAWHNRNAGGRVQRVGQTPPNDYGVHDLHGNIWEWVFDPYGPYKPDAQDNPLGPGTGATRVVRGGSAFNAPTDLRSSLRSEVQPHVRNGLTGFRVARNAAFRRRPPTRG